MLQGKNIIAIFFIIISAIIVVFITGHASRGHPPPAATQHTTAKMIKNHCITTIRIATSRLQHHPPPSSNTSPLQHHHTATRRSHNTTHTCSTPNTLHHISPDNYATTYLTSTNRRLNNQQTKTSLQQGRQTEEYRGTNNLATPMKRASVKIMDVGTDNIRRACRVTREGVGTNMKREQRKLKR